MVFSISMKHIGHHETRSGTYSAPLFDLDNILKMKFPKKRSYE